MTDWNVRDVFFPFTGRCGHKWVAEFSCYACPTCGDWAPVVAEEPIAVNFDHVLDKVQRRIKQAIRANRRKKRKTAAVISLAAHWPGAPPPGP